jgi:NADH dehydrogenase
VSERRLLAVTGGSGFVGRHLVRQAVGAGFEVRALVRSEASALLVKSLGAQPALFRDLEPATLATALAGVSALAHLAQIGAERGDATYRTVNVEGTRAMVRAATEAGVGRIVFFSGLGVARYGMSSRTSSPYFLSKLEAEVEIYRSDLEAVVFRPSYILGPGDGLVTGLLLDMAAGVVEVPGDGTYRMQPIAVSDAAAAILAATPGGGSAGGRHRVFDLVGPEALNYRDFLGRFAFVARVAGRGAGFEIHPVALEEADRRALAGGFHGLLPEELDCMLCDQVADPAPLMALLGRPLMGLDAALAVAIAGTGRV